MRVGSSSAAAVAAGEGSVASRTAAIVRPCWLAGIEDGRRIAAGRSSKIAGK